MERHQWKDGDVVRLKKDNGKRWGISKAAEPEIYEEWFIAEICDCGIAGGWVSTWTLDNEYEFVNNPIDDAQEAIKKEFDKIRECVKESSWSEKDERILINLIDYFNMDDALLYDEEQVIDWLKTLKQRVGG